MMKKILVVCAHPDDETLGLGGTIALHVKNGAKVFVLMFTDGESARNDSNKKILQRQEQAKRACSFLGVHDLKFLNYSDQKLDTIPIIDLARKIESVIEKFKPTIVYTHYWGDVNQDHKKVYEATLIATRPTPSSLIKNLICYETPSSTEWGSYHEKFTPNLFIDIENVLDKKLKALQQYKTQMRSYPHPRSKHAIINRSIYWGSVNGVKYAEAFVSVREIIKQQDIKFNNNISHKRR